MVIGVCPRAPYEQIIKDYLGEDDYQATWIWDQLNKINYTGSYDRPMRMTLRNSLDYYAKS